MVFSHHWIDISGQKSYWWGGGWPVGLKCQPKSQSLSSGLCILDLGLGFGTWIWDLDLGFGFGTVLVLDNFYLSKKSCFSFILILKISPINIKYDPPYLLTLLTVRLNPESRNFYLLYQLSSKFLAMTKDVVGTSNHNFYLYRHLRYFDKQVTLN